MRVQEREVFRRRRRGRHRVAARYVIDGPVKHLLHGGGGYSLTAAVHDNNNNDNADDNGNNDRVLSDTYGTLYVFIYYYRHRDIKKKIQYDTLYCTVARPHVDSRNIKMPGHRLAYRAVHGARARGRPIALCAARTTDIYYGISSSGFHFYIFFFPPPVFSTNLMRASVVVVHETQRS